MFTRLTLSGAEPSAAMSELVLFALNKKGMHKEVIAMCADKEKASDIHKYYLAESIMSGRLSSKSFAEALGSTQVFKGGDDLSACELTQKTKAMFLDGSHQTAIDFFRSELSKRE